MKQNVSPVVIAVAVILLLAVVGYFGYKAVSPPAAISGIGTNGQPMSQADVDKLKERASGGKFKAGGGQ